MPLEPDVPPISSVTYRLFARAVRRSFRRHFRAVIAQRAEVIENASAPLIIYANHCSWWDTLLTILLARELMPGRRHYAPMDAGSLARYPVLRRIGIFPVEMASTRSTAEFLRTAEAILHDGGVLWITPQGRSADVREHPLAFRPALAALAQRVPGVPLFPLAIEYTFWDERLPHTLVRFGDPVNPDSAASTESLTRTLEAALSATMLDLQHASCTRDPTLFRTLLAGANGPASLYGLLRRFRRGVVLD